MAIKFYKGNYVLINSNLWYYSYRGKDGEVQSPSDKDYYLKFTYPMSNFCGCIGIVDNISDLGIIKLKILPKKEKMIGIYRECFDCPFNWEDWMINKLELIDNGLSERRVFLNKDLVEKSMDLLRKSGDTKICYYNNDLKGEVIITDKYRVLKEEDNTSTEKIIVKLENDNHAYLEEYFSPFYPNSPADAIKTYCSNFCYINCDKNCPLYAYKK